MPSKHDPAMVELVARGLVEMSGFAWVTDPMALGQDAFDICQEAIIDAHRMITTLDLPARDAAMLAQGRREGLEMAAGVCDMAGETWNRVLTALKGDGMIRTIHVEVAQTLDAAIRAKIEDVKLPLKPPIDTAN